MRPIVETSRHRQHYGRSSRRLCSPAILALVGTASSVGTANTYPATATVRTLQDMPPSLVLVDTIPLPRRATTSGCPGRLIDPTSREVFPLRSSQGGQVGDYEVESSRYGLHSDEYLRVDCRTLEPLGAVPKPR